MDFLQAILGLKQGRFKRIRGNYPNQSCILTVGKYNSIIDESTGEAPEWLKPSIILDNWGIVEERKTLSDELICPFISHNQLVITGNTTKEVIDKFSYILPAREVKIKIKEFIDWVQSIDKETWLRRTVKDRAIEIFGDKMVTI